MMDRFDHKYLIEDLVDKYFSIWATKSTKLKIENEFFDYMLSGDVDYVMLKAVLFSKLYGETDDFILRLFVKFKDKYLNTNINYMDIYKMLMYFYSAGTVSEENIIDVISQRKDVESIKIIMSHKDIPLDFKIKLYTEKDVSDFLPNSAKDIFLF